MHHAAYSELDLAAAFLFGLLGSTHCLGMCGPLIGLYASQLRSTPSPSAARQHLLFNLGRLLAYTNLGVLCGAAGLALRVRPWIAGTVAIAVGLFVLGVAAGLLGVRGATAWPDRLIARSTGALQGVWRGYVALARSGNVALLGAVHGLLPCPLLYVMFTSAVALGSPTRGGVLLFAFGLGTVPMVWAVGALGQRLSPELRRRWHRVFGSVVAVWGFVLVARGLQGLGAF